MPTSLHVSSLAQHELIVLYFRAHAEPTNRRVIQFAALHLLLMRLRTIVR